jgi:hypothetical protein
MSKPSDFTVKVRNDRDIVIANPEAGFEVTYRREMYSPILIAADVLRNDFHEKKVRLFAQAWKPLITLGYVEERREGIAPNQRLLRLTEKGRRAAEGHRYSGIG